MAWARRGSSTPVTGFNTSLRAGSPGALANDLILIGGVCYAGGDDPPDLSAQGYILIPTAVQNVGLWARIATGSDVMPSYQFGTNFQVTHAAAYSGGPASLAGIVSGTPSVRSSVDTAGFAFQSMTVPVDNCLVIAVGMRNKTSNQDGAAISAFSGFTIVASSYPNGSRPGYVFNEWLQGAKTNIITGGNSTQTTGGPTADATSQPVRGIVVAFQPATSGGNLIATVLEGGFAGLRGGFRG